MSNRILRFFYHFLAAVILTVVTQVGGVVYLLSIVLIKRSVGRKLTKRILVFTLLYLLATFLIVPHVAPIFGREKIKDTKSLRAHSFFYKLANRNYVRPELNRAIAQIATRFSEENPGIAVVYLDANFPFIDNFSMLPHKSHDDGEKLDVSLVYKDYNGLLTNKKVSLSGYGVFEEPRGNEVNQNKACNIWWSDFPKYLRLAKINRDISFSESGTRSLINAIVRQREVGKLFIEPHLKNRMNLSSAKIRFQGCKAVRHDDHIHFQLR